jgi:GNAT superfamily N-acetyltransferase
MNNRYTFKKAGVADRFLIRELAQQIWPHTYGSILSQAQLDYMVEMMYSPESLLRQMEEEHHQYFLVYEGEEAAGYLSIERQDADTFIFQKVYSLPEKHGRGIGRFIIEQGIDYLKSIHTEAFSIILYVNRQNPAVGFYKHLGFRQVDTRDYPIGNGYYMNDYVMQMDLPCLIRSAVESDLPLVLSFIKALAAYEKMSDEVLATEEILRQSLFVEHHAEALIAEAEGRPVGFAVFFHNFSTFLGRPGLYLEDLFVQPEQRGRGIGRALLERLERIAADRHCGRMEWSCLNWNKPSIDFYLSLGARPMSDWTVYRLGVSSPSSPNMRE